jgi:hypothetical protein
MNILNTFIFKQRKKMKNTFEKTYIQQELWDLHQAGKTPGQLLVQTP